MTGIIQNPTAVTSQALNKLSAPSAQGNKGFDSLLKDAVNSVQQAQSDAQQSVNELIDGKGEDLHKTMIAVEKANLSFQLMMEVRNKIISAYQEVSRMAF